MDWEATAGVARILKRSSWVGVGKWHLPFCCLFFSNTKLPGLAKVLVIFQCKVERLAWKTSVEMGANFIHVSSFKSELVGARNVSFPFFFHSIQSTTLFWLVNTCALLVAHLPFCCLFFLMQCLSHCPLFTCPSPVDGTAADLHSLPKRPHSAKFSWNTSIFSWKRYCFLLPHMIFGGREALHINFYTLQLPILYLPNFYHRSFFFFDSPNLPFDQSLLLLHLFLFF